MDKEEKRAYKAFKQDFYAHLIVDNRDKGVELINSSLITPIMVKVSPTRCLFNN